jgi:hypothetical protein
VFDRFFSTLLVLFGSVVTANAPLQGAALRTSGIYLTGADYKNGRLSAEGDCGSKAHKLDLHDVLNKPYIDVTHGTERHRYAKNDLFGFRACDGNDYRFVSNKDYQIVEAKELYIYVTKTSVSAGKGFRTVPVYYLSVGSGGEVLPLTMGNLKEAFPANHKFHDSLDQMFGAGQDIAQYDEFHEMFKVNRLLIATHTQEHD